MARNTAPPKKKQPGDGHTDRTHIIALAIAAIVLVASCLYIHPYIPDDTYISLRYAENLVDGHGLTFNVGEQPVEAYSNLLWILTCAAFYTVGMSLPVVTPVAGVILALGSLFVLWVLYRRRIETPVQLLLPLLLFATAGPFVMYAVSGMEMALFSFLLILQIFFIDDLYRAPRRSAWIGLAISGAFLSITRPEGVVVLPFLLLYLGWDTRRDAQGPSIRRTALIVGATFLLAYAAYTVWRVNYFGSWVPTPFISKGYEAFPILTAWKKNLLQFFIKGAYFEAPSGYYFLALAGLGIAGLKAYAPDERVRRTDRLALILALLMSILYMNFVDWMPAMRYHSVVIALLLLPAAASQRLLPDAAWKHTGGTFHRGVALAAVILLLFGAFGLSRVKMVSSLMTKSRVECLIPLGEWFGRALPANSLIALGDVGAVPYYSGLRTLDIHRESLTDIHIARGEFTAEYLMSRHPQAVALNARGVYSAKMDPLHFELYQSPEFGRNYRFIGTVRHRWYLDRAYWVFVHEDVLISPDILRSFPTGTGTQKQLGPELQALRGQR